MRFNHISKAEQLIRTPGGEVQCGHRHTGSYSAWRETERPAATAAYFDKSYKAFIFACNKHAGTVKGAITRGTYSGRDIIDPRDYGMDLGTIVGNPEASVAVLLKKIADEEERRSERARIAMAIHLGEQWDKRREEYAANDSVEFLPLDTSDDYGLVKVGLRIHADSWRSTTVMLTPAQLRKIIEFGGIWADNAERLTSEAKPPTVTEQERASLNEGAE